MSLYLPERFRDASFCALPPGTTRPSSAAILTTPASDPAPLVLADILIGTPVSPISWTDSDRSFAVAAGPSSRRGCLAFRNTIPPATLLSASLSQRYRDNKSQYFPRSGAQKQRIHLGASEKTAAPWCRWASPESRGNLAWLCLCVLGVFRSLAATDFRLEVAL